MSLFWWTLSLQKFLIFKINLLHKFVIQNAKFSKCLLTNRGVSLLILTKHFQKTLGQSLMIIMIIQTFGSIFFSIVLLIIHGFFIGVMKSKFKMIFQIGFRNGDYFLVSFRTSFVLKFKKDILILLNMEVIWSRLLVQEFYFSFQNFKFLGSSIGILFSFK